MKLTLFARPGCHLCESAERELERLRRRYPHELEVVDISTEPALLERYAERIPVLWVGGREYSAPLPREALERALRTAAADERR